MNQSKASNEPKTSRILQTETVETEINPKHEVESGLVHYDPEVTKVFHTKYDTGEVQDIEITELEL